MRLKLIKAIKKVLKERHKACIKCCKEDEEFLDRWGTDAIEKRRKCKSSECERKCLKRNSIPKELQKEGINKENSIKNLD